MQACIAQSRLNLDGIRHALKTTTVGRRLVLYDVVSSTNTVLRALAIAGAAEGTVVLADAQTEGRGRGNASWFSPPGVNLYASVLCRPGLPPASTPAFAFIGALAVADAIQDDGVTATLKWPHDVLIHGRKLAGVRAEGLWGEPAGGLVILGVGVNLNVALEGLQVALGPQAGQFATTLQVELGQPVDRNAFAARFLNHLEAWMVLQRRQGLPAVLKAWEEREIVTRRRVEVRQGDRRLEGRAIGVNADGHLLLEEPAGATHTVASGEVRLIE